MGARSMVTRRSILACGALSVGLPLLPKTARAGDPPAPPPLPPLPLSVAVAEIEGRPVRDEAWVDAQIAESARLFGPLGVTLVKASQRPLATRFARIETRADRDALVAALTPKQINVMIVESLRDVDTPLLYRKGVHWRNRKAPGRHYCIVAASAWPSTLAHELGHYFGLGHTGVVNNLMSYLRTGGAVFLDDSQADRIRAMARLYVGSKLLEPAPAADPP